MEIEDFELLKILKEKGAFAYAIEYDKRLEAKKREAESDNEEDEQDSPPSPSVRDSMSGAINSSSDEVRSENEV